MTGGTHEVLPWSYETVAAHHPGFVLVSGWVTKFTTLLSCSQIVRVAIFGVLNIPPCRKTNLLARSGGINGGHFNAKLPTQDNMRHISLLSLSSIASLAWGSPVSRCTGPVCELLPAIHPDPFFVSIVRPCLSFTLRSEIGNCNCGFRSSSRPDW